ncbi:MAG: hypothetical protein FWD60_01435 [Candidatus Azobacteroides sp.]|nr:hypothetical protein [Candidatus Azobacteroides sp.]
MEAIKKGKIIKKISWTKTLRKMEVGEFVMANLSERINIVRHITRICKEENKKFSTKKLDEEKIEVKREI